MIKKDELLRIFSVQLRNVLSRLNLNYGNLQEIRLRINTPLIVIYNNREYFVSTKYELTDHIQDAYMITKNEI